MKKRSEMQTLRAGCSKAEPKKFAPLQTPFPGAQDGQNLIVIVVTDPQTHTDPQTGPITIRRTTKLNDDQVLTTDHICE